MFTKHGLHLNSPGKKTYCENLSQALLSIKFSNQGFLLPFIVTQPLNSIDPRYCNDIQLIDITCPFSSVSLCDVSITGLTEDTAPITPGNVSSHSSSLFLENL